MIFWWSCEACSAAGRIEHPGLPITSLVTKAALQHIQRAVDCPLAHNSEVQLLPGRAVFVAERPALERMAAAGGVQ